MNFNRGFNLLKAEISGNARKYREFVRPATPDPTPPGSVKISRKAVVGSGLLTRLTPKGAGAETKNKRIKDTDTAKVKVNCNTNTVENPPKKAVRVMKWFVCAGFSTPFPEGIPFGDRYLLNLMQGGRL